MKKLFFALTLLGFIATANATIFTNSAVSTTIAQDVDDEAPAESASFTQELKIRFIEGGPGFMGIVLICLILGLAIAIERIIFLNLATTNTKKLTESVEAALSSGGINAAKEYCRDTKGPVASIFYQGLDRMDEGIESAEKAVVAYGGVQMGQLEKNVSWISLFIALAPMLGFMGTVIGMIVAFHEMASAGGNIDVEMLSKGIYTAMTTTVAGLIVGIIAFIAYNYLVSKVDKVVFMLEAKTTEFLDLLHHNE